MSATMNVRAAVVVGALGLMSGGAFAQEPLDWHPAPANDATAAAPTVLPGPPVAPGVVTQVGEIVVMEGDDAIVTSLGGTDYAVDQTKNMSAIGQRFFLTYPDQFDGIAVFTTFPDLAQGGAAYALILNSGFGGIGLMGGQSPQSFGSEGRLISVINMNDTDGYPSMDDSAGRFHSVFGQEFGHTWLSFMHFVDPITKQLSNELLGRDNSHWSATFASGGSVMDGMTYTDNGDGTFTSGAYAVQYGPLDLYAMGVIAPEEVGPMFIIRNATYQNGGGSVDPINDGWMGSIGQGTVLLGDRFDFTVDDVVAAEGPRTPAWDEDNEDFRIAFVLVTKPGENAAAVADRIAKLEIGRLAWERKHRTWTMNRSTMCTDVTALCPLAFAEIDSVVVSEDPDDSDGDGIIEPDDRIRIAVTFRNDGSEAATDASALLSSENPGLLLPEAETLPEIPSGGTLEHVFYAHVEPAACGVDLDVAVQATIQSRRWRGDTTFRAGVLDAEPEPFVTEAGWRVDGQGDDTAIQGAFEHGIPAATFFAGRGLQPDGGAGGADDPAWFTDLEGPWDAGEVNGRTTLESPAIDMTGFVGPAIRYKVWYVAYDRPNAMLVTSPDAHLTVEVSGDGGVSWVEIDRVSGEPMRWVEREARVGDALPSLGADVRFRFVVYDDQGPDGRLVEVGIDDVAITTLSGTCAIVDEGGDESGGCCDAAGSSRQAIGSALLALLVALALRRRA